MLACSLLACLLVVEGALVSTVRGLTERIGSTDVEAELNRLGARFLVSTADVSHRVAGSSHNLN